MKTIITIEKEDVIVDGVTKIKRTVKQDNITLWEDITTQEDIDTKSTKIDRFERWVKFLMIPFKKSITQS